MLFHDQATKQILDILDVADYGKKTSYNMKIKVLIDHFIISDHEKLVKIGDLYNILNLTTKCNKIKQ